MDIAGQRSRLARKPTWAWSIAISVGLGAAAATPALADVYTGIDPTPGAVLFLMAYLSPAAPVFFMPLPQAVPWSIAIVWCPLAWAAVIHRARSGLLETHEAVVVLLLVLVVVAVAVPGYLGSLEMRRTAQCDDAYMSAQTALTRHEGKPLSLRCSATDAEGLASCFVRENEHQRNPRNQREPRFTRGEAVTCQVRIVPSGSNRIEVSQQPNASSPGRTYTITIG